MPFARSSARADSERSIASGVGAYLTKPIDTGELEAAIKLAAARHAEFEALEAEVAARERVLGEHGVIPYSGRWQTASMLWPSGSRTKAA